MDEDLAEPREEPQEGLLEAPVMRGDDPPFLGPPRRKPGQHDGLRQPLFGKPDRHGKAARRRLRLRVEIVAIAGSSTSAASQRASTDVPYHTFHRLRSSRRGNDLATLNADPT